MMFIEAYGVRGMQSKSWRETFVSFEALERWEEKHAATHFATREVSAEEARANGTKVKR